MSESASVQDSAGVRLVTMVLDTAGLPHWYFNDPFLVLGGHGGNAALDFTDVVAAWQQDDGEIVVVDAAAKEVRLFSEAGEHVRTVGRRGDGPGEYRLIQSVTRLDGDSIVIWEAQRHRATVLSPTGQLIRTAQLSLAYSRIHGQVLPGAELLNVTAAHGSGWISFAQGTPVPPPGPLPAFVTANVEILRHDIDGAVVDTILRAAGKGFVFAEGDRDVPSGPFGKVEVFIPPLSVQTYVAHGPTHTFVAASNAFEVTALDRAGEIAWIARQPLLEQELTANDAAAFRNRALQRSMTSERRRSVQIMTDVRWAPPRWPTIGALRAGEDGGVWLRVWQRTGTDHYDWLVLDSSGVPRAIARTPRRLAITSVRNRSIVGVRSDSLDVPVVVFAQRDTLDI